MRGHSTPKYRAFLIVVIPFAVYYASLMYVFYTQETLSLDDTLLIHHLSDKGYTLSDLLSPGWQGKYYRPVVDFSFYVEQYLWGDQPFGYRLTNVLIHLLNAVLLYFTTLKLLRFVDNYGDIAFISALMFALHPMSAESIVWISGRTDSLALLFSLLAVIFYFHWKNNGQIFSLFFSFLAMMAAFLAKEVAVATFVLIVLLELRFLRMFGYQKQSYNSTVVVTAVVLIGILLLLRYIVISGRDFGFGFIVAGMMQENSLASCMKMLASFGFYAKKYFFPMPLNFTIFSINEILYAFLGATLLITLFVLFVAKCQKKGFLLLWAMLGIIPAALISYTDVAWTPWAERYLYYSSAPFAILWTLIINDNLKNRNNRFIFPLIVGTICCQFALMSLHRSLTMSSNQLLWRDSYRKSPQFIGAVNGYASTLLRMGQLEEAERIYKEALSLDGPKYLVYLNLGDICYKKGENKMMLEYYGKALEEARKDKRLVTVGRTFRRTILTKLSKYYVEQAQKNPDEALKADFYDKAIEKLLDAFKEEPYNFIYYELARIYLSKGDKENAAEQLRWFLNGGGGEGYTEAARKLLKNLEREIEKNAATKVSNKIIIFQ